MPKISSHFSGYIFAESLLALSLMTLVIGGFLSANYFLYSKTSDLNSQLTLQRVLYEEVADHERYEEVSSQTVYRSDKEYFVTIAQDGEKWIKAEVRHGIETFSIERQ